MQIVAGVIFPVVGLCAIAFVVWLIMRKHKKQSQLAEEFAEKIAAKTLEDARLREP